MRRGWAGLWAVALLAGCASSRPSLEAAPRDEVAAGPAVDEAGDSAPPGEAAVEAPWEAGEPGAGGEAFAGTRFVDRELGFEIVRPDGEAWRFSPGHEAPEGIVVPVVVLHTETGAQVVVQIAPEVAPAQEFAERLAVGLRTKPGFTTTVPEPTRSGSAFAFTMGSSIQGRVGITSTDGRLYVLLGTWPTSAPHSVARDVSAIMGSLKIAVLHDASVRF